jgi:hypothetical protein
MICRRPSIHRVFRPSPADKPSILWFVVNSTTHKKFAMFPADLIHNGIIHGKELLIVGFFAAFVILSASFLGVGIKLFSRDRDQTKIA